MTTKERKQEEQELASAVKVLGAAIRSMAHRKAERYELEFLYRVRDMIDAEIGTRNTVSVWCAETIGKEIEVELKK